MADFKWFASSNNALDSPIATNCHPHTLGPHPLSVVQNVLDAHAPMVLCVATPVHSSRVRLHCGLARRKRERRRRKFGEEKKEKEQTTHTTMYSPLPCPSALDQSPKNGRTASLLPRRVSLCPFSWKWFLTIKMSMLFSFQDKIPGIWERKETTKEKKTQIQIKQEDSEVLKSQGFGPGGLFNVIHDTSCFVLRNGHHDLAKLTEKILPVGPCGYSFFGPPLPD